MNGDEHMPLLPYVYTVLMRSFSWAKTTSFA
jgi:hypothetical protein